MRRVHFELLEKKTMAHAWWGFLLAWLIALLLLNSWRLQLWQPKASLQHDAGNASQLPTAAIPTPTRLANTPVYFESASKALRQQRAWWRPLLTSIESRPLAGIQLISVDISSDDEVARVTIQANDLALVLAHVDELNSSSTATHWMLQNVEIQPAAQGPGKSSYRVSLRGSVK
jgi:hypothetical protein